MRERIVPVCAISIVAGALTTKGAGTTDGKEI